MRRTLFLAAGVCFVAFGSLFAQDELPRKHASDDPPKSARLRIGTTKLREIAYMRDLAFLPDGKHVVTTNGPLVHHWNLESGLMVNAHSFKPSAKKKKVGAKFVPGRNMIRTTALSPDGKTFAAFIKNDVYMAPFDVAGVPEYTLKPPSSPFGSRQSNALAFARVGMEEVIVLLNENGIVEIMSKEKAKFGAGGVFTGITNAKFFLVSGSRCIVANEEGFLGVYDLETRKRISQLSEKQIQHVSLAGDGKHLAIRCNEDELVIRDIEKNEEISRKKADAKMWSIALSPTADRIFSYNIGNQRVEMRDLKRDKILFSDRARLLTRVAPVFSSDGKRCAVLGDHAIFIWDATTGKSLTPPGFFGTVTNLNWLQNGEIFAASADGTTRRWDAKTGKEKDRFEETIHSWIFTNDEQVVYLLKSDSVRQRDMAKRSEKVIAEMPERKFGGPHFSAIAISPDGKTLAIAENGIVGSALIHLHNLETKKKVSLKLDQPEDALIHVKQLLFVSENVLLCQSLRDDISVWDLQKQQVIRRFPAGETRIYSAYAGQRLIVSGDRKFIVGPDFLESRKFSTTNPPVIAFWEIETGKRVKHFTIDSPPSATALSPDGKTIVTGDQNGTVHVWDVASTNRILHEPNAHRGAVTAIAFAADGRSFATGSADTSILVWDMPRAK